MAKPKFRIHWMKDHPSIGPRIQLSDVNWEACKMIRDRDNGRIPDFPLVIYHNETNCKK